MGAYGHSGFQFSQLSRFLQEGDLISQYAERLNLRYEGLGSEGFGPESSDAYGSGFGSEGFGPDVSGGSSGNTGSDSSFTGKRYYF